MAEDWANNLPSAGDDDNGFGSPDYSFEDVDVAGADGSKIGSGNIKISKAGFYHFSITAEAKPKPHEEHDISKQRKPSILCICKLLKAANGQPDGAIHYHELVMGGKGGGPMTDMDRDKTLNFLVGLGILKNSGGKVIDPETGTTTIRSATLVDRINKVGQFVGNLHLTPANTSHDGRVFQERIEFNFGRGVFPVTAREVAHVPKNEEALKSAGISLAPAKVNC